MLSKASASPWEIQKFILHNTIYYFALSSAFNVTQNDVPWTGESSARRMNVLRASDVCDEP